MESIITLLTESLFIAHDGPTLATLPQMGSFLIALTTFILAVIVGYHVVWQVTPALHAPLMSMTNVISSVIIVGALMGVGSAQTAPALAVSTCALFLICVNIAGGLVITHRMLSMFTRKKGN